MVDSLNSSQSAVLEKPAKNSVRMGVNVGSSSILLIFVVLCLVAFATLSLVSANADRLLSRRILERTTGYYGACSEAEAWVAEQDRELADIFAAASSRAAYLEQVGEGTRTFRTSVSDTQDLEVILEILYPEAAGDAFYRITSWKVINTAEYEYDSTLPVFRQ